MQRTSPEALVGRAHAEHIRTRGAHIVPPSHRKVQVFLHRLAEDDAVGVVEFKGEGILGFGAFVFDVGQIGKNLAHIRFVSFF